MIGAMDNEDALYEANRSLSDSSAVLANLEMWNGEAYRSCQ